YKKKQCIRNLEQNRLEVMTRYSFHPRQKHQQWWIERFASLAAQEAAQEIPAILASQQQREVFLLFNQAAFTLMNKVLGRFPFAPPHTTLSIIMQTFIGPVITPHLIRMLTTTVRSLRHRQGGQQQQQQQEDEE